MRPLTDGCPKPLLPLGAEPLVGYQLRRLAETGVGHVVLATGYLADCFEKQLGDGQRWGIRLDFSVEHEPLGTAGALRVAIDRLPEVDQVIVLNGDLLSSHDLAAQLDSTGAGEVCLHVRAVPDVAPYGHVTCDDRGRVTEFAEKTGTGAGLANAGTYVVPADLLRSLPEGRSSWERDVLPAVIESDTTVVAWEGAGYFRDVGSPETYRLACIDAVTGRLPGALPCEHELYVAPGATVSDGARLSGGSSLHEGVVVEGDAELDGCVVLAGSRIGAGAHLARCVVAQGVTVPAAAVRQDEIVTESATHR